MKGLNVIDFTHRLRALATSPRTPVNAEVPTNSGDEKSAVFRLYDPIDSWGGDFGVSAKEFVAALDELPDGTGEIRLHINSPGGDVFEGIAILNALRSHDARIVAVVDGLAASAASFLACGADELVMARNSELMIHDPWGLCVGNAADMRDLAEKLDHFADNIASVYADKAGGDVAEWRAAMAAETWFSAKEAVEAGLADRVDARKSADKAKDQFDLSIFTYAGRAQAPAPDVTPDPTPPVEDTAADAAAQAAADAAVADDEERERFRQRVRAWQHPAA